MNLKFILTDVYSLALAIFYVVFATLLSGLVFMFVSSFLTRPMLRVIFFLNKAKFKCHSDKSSFLLWRRHRRLLCGS